MNIVHVTGYYPPHAGGMEYRIQDLSVLCAKRGHHVDVITSDIGCKTRTMPSENNLRVHYLNSREFAHTPFTPMLFFHLLRIPRGSAIHLHIAHAFIPEILWLVCKIRRMPYIATVHLDVSSSGFFGFLLPLYKRFFLSRVIRDAHTITVLTEDYKHLVSRKYAVGENRIRVIPNGTRCIPAANRRTTLHTPVRLLFVGRLSVQKNIPLLINALQIAVYRYALPLHLSLAGSGEKEQEIRRLIQQNQLEQAVTMPGTVSAEDAQKLYHTSDIFILPSREESFGTVLIEAMASGIPIIATDISAVRNTVINGYTGILVRQTPEDLAHAIRLLIQRPALRRKLVRNGLNEAKQFDWETVTDQFEDVYRNSLCRTTR